MNQSLFDLINGLAGRSAGLDAVMVAAATWLIYGVFVVGAVLTLLALFGRRLARVGCVAASLVLAYGLNLAVAALVSERRPFEVHRVHQLIAHSAGHAMPSDHATAAFTVALATLVFLDRAWGVVLTVAAVVIAFSRGFVGVHYPGDVAAGLAIAVVSVVAVAAVATLWWRLLRPA
jgi:undecaprenyl-diphosphatase